MDVPRKDRDDDKNLSTADDGNPVRDRSDTATPRQAYGVGLELSHIDRDRLDSAPVTAASSGSALFAGIPTGAGRPMTMPEGSVVTDRKVTRVDRYILYPEGLSPTAELHGSSDRAVSAGSPANVGTRGTPGGPIDIPNPMDAPPNDPPDYTPPPKARPASQAPTAPRAPQPVPAPPLVSHGPVPTPAPFSNPGPVAVPAGSTGPGRPGPLFAEDELHKFRARWDQIQTSFVDEPRRAVESADSLVANVVKRIAEQFANERETLEKQWDRGDDVNTEDLRQALKRYRAFFDRLLAF